MSNDEYISAREAQARLQRTDRQIRRYAESGRVRTRLQGNRIQYHRGDIEKLAGTLQPDERPRVPDQQIIPAGDLLVYVRELQQQIAEAAAREGYLRAQLDTRPRVEDSLVVQAELERERIHRQALEKELSNTQGDLSTAQGGQRRANLLAIVSVALLFIVLVVTIVYLIVLR